MLGSCMPKMQATGSRGRPSRSLCFTPQGIAIVLLTLGLTQRNAEFAAPARSTQIYSHQILTVIFRYIDNCLFKCGFKYVYPLVIICGVQQRPRMRFASIASY
jgi:hypothetical protein